MTKSGKLLTSLILGSVIVLLGWDIVHRVLLLRNPEPVPVTNEISAPPPEGVGRRQKTGIQRQYRAIIERNIFGSAIPGQSLVDLEEVERLEPTSLKIVLHGTIVGNRSDSRAIIYDQDSRKQELYLEGDSVKNAVVKRILRGRVVLRVGGSNQVLLMAERQQSNTGRQPRVRKKPGWHGRGIGFGTRDADDSQVLLDLEEALRQAEENDEVFVSLHADIIRKLLADGSKVEEEIALQPNIGDGTVQGIRVMQKKPGMLVPQLGLRPGDIIMEMDGKSPSSGEEVLAFYKTLESGGSGSIIVMRQNQLSTINYNIR